jgi:hypothetical protein
LLGNPLFIFYIAVKSQGRRKAYRTCRYDIFALLLSLELEE